MKEGVVMVKRERMKGVEKFGVFEGHAFGEGVEG